MYEKDIAKGDKMKTTGSFKKGNTVGMETRFQEGHEVQLGEKHWNYGGGRYITDHGYVRILIGPKKYRYEHRLVMEKKLGRPLLRTELCHHINGDRADNREENLELVSHSGHDRRHRRKG